MLTANQIDQYKEEGAVIVPGVVDQTTLKQMKLVLAELVEQSRAVSAHTDVFDLEPGHTAEDPRVRRIKKPHLVNAVFLDYMRSPILTKCLQQLIGLSARLNTSKLNLKAPGFGSPVEWHQDWAFYPHTNDDILAVGVMLDDTTVENGAIMTPKVTFVARWIRTLAESIFQKQFHAKALRVPLRSTMYAWFTARLRTPRQNHEGCYFTK
jgi:phytanoyl-CoA hydroxylase